MKRPVGCIGAATGARTRIFCAFVKQRLYPLSYCRFLLWLLITGWLTLWRGHSRVCPALLMHHPDVVLPAGPSVCAELADCPDRCALLHAAGATSVRAGS